MDLEKRLSEYFRKSAVTPDLPDYFLNELGEINSGLMSELENIEKHYKNTSLFLETLLRRSHFDKGRLTLLTKKCFMNMDVVQPQLERFRKGSGIWASP